MKRRSLFSILIVLLLAFSLFTACNGNKTPVTSNTLNNIKNEFGASVEGGSFPEGSTLVSTPIEETSDEGKEALDTIKGQEYNESKPVYIFDVSVIKDNAKVQPDGKVKVVIPVTADLASYNVVLHIKDSGTVERLSATYADGKITFETDSFSIFVLVEPVVVNHTHTFSGEWSHNETSHWHAATCEHTDERSDESEHEWGNGTDNGDGQIKYVCTVCGCEKLEPAQSHTHTFSGEWSHNETYHWHAATCEHTDEKSDESEHEWDNGTDNGDGQIKYVCTVCGCEKLEAAQSHTHTFSKKWSYDEKNHWHAATCEHTNLRSDESTHKWDDGTVITPATEKEDGQIKYVCTVCGCERTEPISQHTHTFSREWSQSKTHHWHAATCGHDVKDSYEEHYYSGSWDIITPATETEEGEKVRVCIGCKYEDHTVIPKTTHVHTFSEDWTSNGEYHWHAATCSHTSEIDGKELCSGGNATCTQKAICSVCGKEYGDTLDHDFTKKVIDEKYLATPATCLAHATYYYSCKVCGAKGTETFEDTSGKLAYCNYNEADVCTVCEVPASAWLKFKEIKDSDGHVVAYKVTGVVSSYNNRKTEYVRVPETYNDKPVTVIGEGALYFSSLKHVVLSDSIVEMEGLAPLPQHIETLVIGKGLKTIADDSFKTNGYLKQITVSEDNPNFKMVDGVMYSKDGKTLVKYPDLREGKEYVIGNDVERIWGYAFRYTKNIKSVVIPDSVTEMGTHAFESSSITAVDIGSGLTTIPEYAFDSSQLKRVELDNNITTIGEHAFSYSAIETVSFGKKVTTIGYSAFSNSKLKEIIIPDNVTSIGMYAFQYTYSVTKVVIGTGITEIPQNAFEDSLCGSKNATLTIGSNVKTIGAYAFNGATGITSLNIPASVTTLGSSAFAYCSNLTSLVIPDTVESMGTACFLNCKSLESVTLNNTLTEIPDGTFSRCTSLKSITIPNCVKTIGGSAFFACTSLDTVNFGTGLTTIGKGAFENCYALTSITIPDGVETIEHYAFEECTALKTVVLPSSIHKISTATFKDCKALESVTFTGSEPKVLYFEYDAVYTYTFDTVEKTTDMLSNKVSVLNAYYMYTIAAFNNDHKYHPITEETTIVRWEERETA